MDRNNCNQRLLLLEKDYGKNACVVANIGKAVDLNQNYFEVYLTPTQSKWKLKSHLSKTIFWTEIPELGK